MTQGLTPDRILEVWKRHPARLIDTFGSDDAVFSQVVDQIEQAALISDICRWISEQSADLGGFVETFGYQWAISPRAYHLASEAAWQARILQQLSSLWLHDHSIFPLNEVQQEFSRANVGNVVVRQTLVTSYGLMTPTYRPLENIHFIILPQSFFDFASLIWRSFATWCHMHRLDSIQSAEDDQAWNDVVARLSPVTERGKPDSYLLEVIARDLAQPSRDMDVSELDMAGLIADQVPFFAESVRILNSAQLMSFDAHVSYALADFSLSHELGHRIAGHLPGPRAASNELSADRIAFDLFFASGGWRSPLFERSPLIDLTMPLFGSIVFHQTIRLRAALQTAINARLSEAFPGAPLRGAGVWGEAERERADQMSSRYFNLVLSLAKSRNRVPFDAIQLIVNLSTNIADYASHLIATVRTIPLADIVAAHDLARRSG